MKRFAVILGTVIALTLPTSLALAHGQSVQVSPTAASTGDTITLTGTDLGDNISVPVHLIATDGTQYDLGIASTDDDGGFSAKFSVPALPVGVYQIHAVGIEPAMTNFGLGIDASQVPAPMTMPDDD